MASAAVSLPPIPSYHDLHPKTTSPGPLIRSERDIESSSVGSPEQHHSPTSDFESQVTPQTSFTSDMDPHTVFKHNDPRYSAVDRGRHVNGNENGTAGLSEEGMPLGGPTSIPTRNPTASAKLEDFELIRVLGKGCAGRVSCTVLLLSS